MKIAGMILVAALLIFMFIKIYVPLMREGPINIIKAEMAIKMSPSNIMDGNIETYSKTINGTLQTEELKLQKMPKRHPKSDGKFILSY